MKVKLNKNVYKVDKMIFPYSSNRQKNKLLKNTITVP